MLSKYHEHIFPQVTDGKSMIERSEHTITAITISSSLVVVFVFGRTGSGHYELSHTVVLEFGEYTIVMKHSVLHVCMICKYTSMCCEHRCEHLEFILCCCFYEATKF